MKRIKLSQVESIRRKVYKKIKDMILTGELSQNERIYEEKIAKMIGVSRTPVREALHALEHEGLLISKPRSGYIVKPLRREEVYEICEIRKVVEGLALVWAVKRNRERLIMELKKNVEMCEKKLKNDDVKFFVDLDARFHATIAKLSGSERLLELATTLRRHMLRYRIQSIYVKDNVQRAIEGHKSIIKAIEDGSEEKLVEALHTHIDKSREDILRYAFSE